MPPPLSPPRVPLPPFSDIIGRYVGIIVGVHWLKRTRIGTGPSSSSPQQPCLIPISSYPREMNITLVLMELTLRLSQSPWP
jgi:hypothetical protein